MAFNKLLFSSKTYLFGLSILISFAPLLSKNSAINFALEPVIISSLMSHIYHVSCLSAVISPDSESGIPFSEFVGLPPSPDCTFALVKGISLSASPRISFSR